MSAIHFVIYSRSYCHLCEDMLHALEALRPEGDFTVEMIDVDADPVLLARYDELVPVLVGHKPDTPAQQLCHYFLDPAAVMQFFPEGN